MVDSDVAPTADDLTDIQGNLIGFNKDRMRLLFVAFPDQQSGRAFLASLHGEINHAAEVKRANHDFKKATLAGEDPLAHPTCWVNIAINHAGLAALGAPELDAFTGSFANGMKAQAGAIGDNGPSDPSAWTEPFRPTDPVIHAVIIIAGDLLDLLDDRTAVIKQRITTAGITLVGQQEGNTRSGEMAGHEHFGFKDGISQPSIAGVTTSSKGGPDITAGEFLIGYQNQDGNVSGQGVAQPPRPAQPGEPGYPGNFTPPSVSLPSWARNGSFLVYRKLQQNVGGFLEFLQANANEAGLTAEQLAAKMVGRWPSGAPLERVAPEPIGSNTTSTDPSAQTPEVLADNHINAFGYADHDLDGHIVPKAAHIRRSYPRDAQPPGTDESNRHRILRRGIPYGAEFIQSEPPYPGSGSVPDTQDRGLLFLCYQAAIESGFEFIQQSWINNTSFPDPGQDNGLDPIVSQNTASPGFSIGNVHLVTSRWVVTTGGDYFFSPAISALKTLASS